MRASSVVRQRRTARRRASHGDDRDILRSSDADEDSGRRPGRHMRFAAVREHDPAGGGDRVASRGPGTHGVGALPGTSRPMAPADVLRISPWPCPNVRTSSGFEKSRRSIRSLARWRRGSAAGDRPRSRRDSPVRPSRNDRAGRRGTRQHRDDLVERTWRSPRHEPGDPPGIPSRPGETVPIEARPEEEGLPAAGACGLAEGHRTVVDPPADGHLALDLHGPMRPAGRSGRLAGPRPLSHSRTRFAGDDRRCDARAQGCVG